MGVERRGRRGSLDISRGGGGRRRSVARTTGPFQGKGNLNDLEVLVLVGFQFRDYFK